MNDSSMIQQLLVLLADHAAILTLAGSFLGGEETIIGITALLTHQGVPLWKPYVFASIGTLCSDTLIATLAKTKFYDHLANMRLIKNAHFILEQRVAKNDKTGIRTLLISKFIYGTRIFTMLHISKNKVTLRQFILYDFVVILTWLIPITIIGWLAGKGIAAATTALHRVEIGILLLVLVIALIAFAQRKVRSRVRGVGK